MAFFEPAWGSVVKILNYTSYTIKTAFKGGNDIVYEFVVGVGV
jgi:hypothetical protein